MSQLRVGDIEIDGSRVTISPRSAEVSAFGHRQPGQDASSVPVPTSARAPLDPLEALDQLLIPAKWTARAGLASLALGVGGLLWSPPSDVFTFLFHGGAFVSLGLGLVVVGRLQRVRLKQREADAARSELTALAPVIERLSSLLVEPDPSHTFEWIRDETRLPSDLLVKALAIMRDRKDLVEEYSDVTAAWHYFSSPHTLNLESRLRTLRSNKP